MKLYSKVIKLTLLSILTGICLLYIASRILLLKNTSDLEKEDTLSNTLRVLHFIDKDMIALDSINLEYSQWDETYEFMENRDMTFINSNFGDDLSSFKNLNIAFLAFVDNSGEIVFSENIPNTSQISSDLNFEIQRDITSKVNFLGSSKRLKGILISNDIPLLINAQPIVKNHGLGPNRGTFILAKYIDNNTLKSLSHDLSLNIKSQNFDQSILENTYHYKDSNNIYMEILDKNTIRGYALIKDIFNNPALLITVDIPRTLFKYVQNNIRIYVLILFVVASLCTVLVIISMNSIIIRKILSIKTVVDTIAETGDLSRRIHIEGEDEIADLSRKINNMFDSLQKFESKLIYFAYYDTLTGLSNRKSIMNKIQRLIDEDKTKFALHFIDLDNFKNINDSLGHDAGDYILETVSDKLNSLINENCLVGRLGGDEFIIVQNNISSVYDAEILAKKICDSMKPTVNYKEHEISIGSSIGISFFPKDGKDLPTLIKNADSAMYAAKNSGGYTYKFYSKNVNP